MPYLSVAAINAAVDHITATYPALAVPVALPEASVEGRPVKALKIGDGTGTGRTAVLFLGGTHARELINPETLISFALRLCDAYINNTGLAFGPRTYDPGSIQSLVKTLDIVLVPMVNPDGRNYCLVGGDPMWRKNRANHPGNACRGVDLNRNYDFLWSSGIGTSSNSCSDVYKGPSAFSEPETRNVRWLIDQYTNLSCLVDVHSYSELVLYPWGDDENQTTDPNQNFLNPAFDGQRGVVGSGYKEYIPAADEQAHEAMGQRVRDGIAAVRGRTYMVQPSIALYPTTGTAHDYAYAHHFVHTGRRRILGYTLETARTFQPGDVEKNNVITEVSAGLMEFLLETLCPADVIQALVDALFPLDDMRRFRDNVMVSTKAGKRYEQLFRKHSDEVARLFSGNKAALKAGTELLTIAGRMVDDDGNGAVRKIGPRDVTDITTALTQLQKLGSPELKADLSATLKDLEDLQGNTMAEIFVRLSKPR
jgi:murein tripeptide amidase MpaA